MLGLVKYIEVDIVTDTFLEQNTILILKYNLLDIKKILKRIYLFYRVLQRLKDRTMLLKYSVDIKSEITSGAKAVTASILDIASVRKLLKNKKLQYYKYIKNSIMRLYRDKIFM